MCQYSATDAAWSTAGTACTHPSRTPGLLIVEATAVSPRPHHPGCLGLMERAAGRRTQHRSGLDQAPRARCQDQIGHAGRKEPAQTARGRRRRPSPPTMRAAGRPSPSPTAFGAHLPKLPARDDDGRHRPRARRTSSPPPCTRGRLRMAGLPSPTATSASASSRCRSQRSDAGGSFENHQPLPHRDRARGCAGVTGEPAADGCASASSNTTAATRGTLAESVELAAQLQARGLDFLNVSVGYSTLARVRIRLTRGRERVPRMTASGRGLGHRQPDRR